MYSIRLIQAQDNAALAQIIRQVSSEYGLASDAGFAVADPILDQLFSVYNVADSRYWVVTDENEQVLGGGGIAPLTGDTSLLEIQKMYFLPCLRGQGFAKKILNLCFEFAHKKSYVACYLETTASLKEAAQLYKKLGFICLEQPRGKTGHSQACELWMLKSIN